MSPAQQKKLIEIRKKKQELLLEIQVSKKFQVNNTHGINIVSSAFREAVVIQKIQMIAINATLLLFCVASVKNVSSPLAEIS